MASGASLATSARSGRARPARLADGADQLPLAPLGASLDREPGGLAAELGDRHRAGAAAGPLRGPALALRGLGALAAERGAGLLGELRDGLLLARPRPGLLDVPTRGLALLLRRQCSSLLGGRRSTTQGDDKGCPPENGHRERGR